MWCYISYIHYSNNSKHKHLTNSWVKLWNSSLTKSVYSLKIDQIAKMAWLRTSWTRRMMNTLTNKQFVMTKLHILLVYIDYMYMPWVSLLPSGKLYDVTGVPQSRAAWLPGGVISGMDQISVSSQWTAITCRPIDITALSNYSRTWRMNIVWPKILMTEKFDKLNHNPYIQKRKILTGKILTNSSIFSTSKLCAIWYWINSKSVNSSTQSCGGEMEFIAYS